MMMKATMTHMVMGTMKGRHINPHCITCCSVSCLCSSQASVRIYFGFPRHPEHAPEIKVSPYSDCKHVPEHLEN